MLNKDFWESMYFRVCDVAMMYMEREIKQFGAKEVWKDIDTHKNAQFRMALRHVYYRTLKKLNQQGYYDGKESPFTD